LSICDSRPLDGRSRRKESAMKYNLKKALSRVVIVSSEEPTTERPHRSKSFLRRARDGDRPHGSSHGSGGASHVASGAHSPAGPCSNPWASSAAQHSLHWRRPGWMKVSRPHCLQRGRERARGKRHHYKPLSACQWFLERNCTLVRFPKLE